MANTVFRNAMGHVREEKGISSINTDTMAFSTPPSLRATSPIFLRCKNTPPCCGTRQGRGLCYKGLSFPAKESPCYTNSLYLIILLNSEKNEPRSAAAVIGLLGLSLWSPSGSAELASLGQSSPFFLRLPCDFTAR